MGRNRNRRSGSGQQVQRQQNQPTRQQGGPAHQTARGAAQHGQVAFETYQGVLPHPEHLARIDQLAPGSAEKIINEFVAQGEHRRGLETTVVEGTESRSGKGQLLGFIILMSGVIAGLIIALAVDAKAGAATIGGVIAGGALIYVIGGRPPRTKS